MSRDSRLLFATRSFRLFAYGFLPVVLMIYLAQLGLKEKQIGPLLAQPSLLSLPFFLSGGLKIIYDLLLYRRFHATKPPEENGEKIKN